LRETKLLETLKAPPTPLGFIYWLNTYIYHMCNVVLIRQILALITISIFLTIVIILLISGAVNLSDCMTALAVGLSLACFGIGY
jgi:UDP-N-acetylmuramyl pentapeptide phosphotransferase/UDP-N-acetylglucosamine-1-phosphate transferase